MVSLELCASQTIPSGPRSHSAQIKYLRHVPRAQSRSSQWNAGAGCADARPTGFETPMLSKSHTSRTRRNGSDAWSDVVLCCMSWKVSRTSRGS